MDPPLQDRRHFLLHQLHLLCPDLDRYVYLLIHLVRAPGHLPQTEEEPKGLERQRGRNLIR